MRDSVESSRILVRSAKEVPVAALQRKAVRERVEACNYVHDGLVDGSEIECRQSPLSLRRVLRVLDKFPRLREGLHLVSLSLAG